MARVMTHIGISAILLGSGLALGIGASPASAAMVRPDTATNCSWVGTHYGGVDPHYYGFQATCSDGPTSEWRLDLTCESYGGKIVTAYGTVVTGTGSSASSCPGANYEVDGIYIENIL